MSGRKIVLILGASDHTAIGADHGLHIAKKLTEIGVSSLFLDSRTFPRKTGLSFWPETGEWVLQLGGREFTARNIHSVYWRTYLGPRTHRRVVSQNDSRSLLESFLISFPVRWINPWAAIKLHDTKPVQLAIAKKVGAQIPRTLLSNLASDAIAFTTGSDPLIFKPVQGGYPTKALTDQTREQIRSGSLDLSPATFQEQIAGRDIRVFCFDDLVFAIGIDSEGADFREDRNAKFSVHSLPSEIVNLVREIRRALGLRFTGMDFKLTSEGRYVFLEANSSPMFIGFESRTGLPLTESLLRLLVTE